jgi:hypothetical protein
MTSRAEEVVMTWARIDENAPLHPKLIRAGCTAVGLWLAGVCYCNRLLSDGVIPAKDLPMLIPGISVRTAKRAIRKLVSVGLWHERPGGYEVHDFLDYNPSRADVLARRAATKEAGRRGALKRWGMADPMANPKAEAIAKPIASSIGICIARPARITTKAFVVSAEVEPPRLRPPNPDADFIAAEANRFKRRFVAAAARLSP